MSIIFTNTPKEAIQALVATGDFVLDEDIPLFASHERDEVKDGKPIKVTIKDSDLSKICENTNALIGGYLPCITIGHRCFDKGFPEDKQPPVIGFLFGVYQDDGIIKVHALIKKSRYADYLSYPYRSAEYVHQSQAIIGMAVLTRPPFLGVGTRVAVYQYDKGKIGAPKVIGTKGEHVEFVFRRKRK